MRPIWPQFTPVAAEKISVPAVYPMQYSQKGVVLMLCLCSQGSFAGSRPDALRYANIAKIPAKVVG